MLFRYGHILLSSYGKPFSEHLPFCLLRTTFRDSCHVRLINRFKVSRNLEEENYVNNRHEYLLLNEDRPV
jgi:hypothetical protein